MTEKKNAPAIRFTGFTAPWEQRKVGELCSISTGKSNTQDKNDDGIYPFYVRSPIIEKSNKYLYDEEAVITVGDGVGTGKVFHYVNGKYDLHQRCYRMYGFSDELNAKYFYHTFSLLFYKRVMAMTAKTSVDSVRLEMISDMEIPTPSIDEQLKIGQLFTNIDTLITLHQRELDKLHNSKKSLLAKMFPKGESNVPEIRFKGFTAPWEQRKLSDTLNFLSNNTLSRAELSEDTGTYKNVHYGDVLIKFGEYIDAQSTDLPYIADDEKAKKFESSKLQDGDIIIADTAEDEAVGKCLEIGNIGDLSIVSGLHTIPCRPKVKFAPAYLGFYLNSASYHDQLIPLMQGIKVTSISKSAISDTMISAPTDLSEQGKIGQFFTRLDSLITLHQRKLEKLKNIKKSMLEKMFV